MSEICKHGIHFIDCLKCNLLNDFPELEKGSTERYEIQEVELEFAIKVHDRREGRVIASMPYFYGKKGDKERAIRLAGLLKLGVEFGLDMLQQTSQEKKEST